MYQLKRSVMISRPLAEIFPFFEQPENHSKLTPPALHFTVLSPTPIVMKTGAQMDHRISLFGIPIHWRTLITEYSPPSQAQPDRARFQDEQLKGPYKVWRHTHLFQEVNGQTAMTDIVDYDLYGGPFKVLAQALYVKRAIEEIFAYRNQIVRQLFSAPQP